MEIKKLRFTFSLTVSGAVCVCMRGKHVFACPVDDHYYPSSSNLFYRAPGPLLSSLCVCVCLNGPALLLDKYRWGPFLLTKHKQRVRQERIKGRVNKKLNLRLERKKGKR